MAARRLRRIASHLRPPCPPARADADRLSRGTASASTPEAAGGDHDGPGLPMTDEQRFFFDLRGWLLLPAVLTAAEISRYRAAVYAQSEAPLNGVSPSPHPPTRPRLADPSLCQGATNTIVGNGYTGVLSELLDHPAVAGILAELLSEPPFRNDPDTHPFRCEDSFTTMRRGGFEPVGTTMPHGVRPPQLASGVSYRAEGGQIFGGLIRVCWELAPVERGEGGT